MQKVAPGLPFRCDMAVDQPAHCLAEPQRFQVGSTDGFVTNAADVFAAFFEIHADFLGRFKGDNLADIMEQGCNYELVPCSYLTCQDLLWRGVVSGTDLLRGPGLLPADNALTG